MSISGTPEATGVDASTPRGKLGYAPATASQGSITTTTDLTGLSTAVTVASGRSIKITGHVRSWSSTTASDRVDFSIQEGATVLNQVVVLLEPAANTAAGGGQVMAIVENPSAGSHTYKLTAGVEDGGTVTMTAGATFPAFILVEDIGAA